MNRLNGRGIDVNHLARILEDEAARVFEDEAWDRADARRSASLIRVARGWRQNPLTSSFLEPLLAEYRHTYEQWLEESNYACTMAGAAREMLLWEHIDALPAFHPGKRVLVRIANNPALDIPELED